MASALNTAPGSQRRDYFGFFSESALARRRQSQFRLVGLYEVRLPGYGWMLFGEFLLCRQALTANQLSEALIVQNRRRTPVSRIAVESGFVAGDRELELGKKLDAAIRVACATVLHEFCVDQDEIRLILDRYQSSAPRIGELLVELGYLTRAQLAAELKDFQDL